MFVEYRNSKYLNTDLNIVCFGHEDCHSNHSWGPGIRDHYLIHYIINGKGIYKIEDNTYNIKAGEVFLAEPETLIYYEADDEDPWEYVWIGFNGTKANHYLSQIHAPSTPPHLALKEQNEIELCVMEMIQYSNNHIGRDIILQSYLYKFIYLIVTNLNIDNSMSKKELPENYVEAAANYISSNYSSDITIDEVSRYLNITRAYLFKLFKKYLKTSPQQFLINFRMEKSCDLLKNTTFAIGDIARSVGYRDVLLFSKIFKKTYGITPTDFRSGQKEIKDSVSRFC